jgi:Sulfotransferase family
MCKNRRAYDLYARLTFKGIPRFRGDIVVNPEQWAISGRRGKQVVVKDVNPLVLRELWERFRPRIVLLVRHPVSVARSFHALGWTSDQFRTRFLPKTLAGFAREHALPSETSTWEQSGAFQAITQNFVANSLSGIDHVVVRYEDVCRDPVSEFDKIFEFCGLPFSAAVRKEVERSSHARSDYVPGTYDTNRNSLEMRDRWRLEVAPEDVEQVRCGYFAFDPIFYREESDW